MKFFKRLYKRILQILPVIVISIIFSYCTENKTPMEENDNAISFNIDDFEIHELPLFERPLYNFSSPVDLNAEILVWEWRGNRYYHPVNITISALHNIYSYYTTQNPEYLSRAEKYMQKLVEVSFRIDDNIYLPYSFDISPHGDIYDELHSPWYSGMAQGIGLAALVRLYNITGKTEYLEASREIFSTFKRFRSENDIWTVFVDEGGYYWIEEYAINYPDEAAGRVLNGFISAIYGLYDYYLLTKDSDAKDILLAAITTIYRYMPDFRDVGDVSFYCLRHLHKDKAYHFLHQSQLSLLTKITGDPFFQSMADSLYNDYH